MNLNVGNDYVPIHIEEYISLLIGLGGWEPAKARAHARKLFIKQHGKTPEQMAEEHQKRWDEMMSNPAKWKTVVFKAGS